MSATNRGSQRHKDDFYTTPAWVTSLVLPLLPAGGAWLDAGCGEGAILRHLPTRATRYGIELNAARAKLAQKHAPSARISVGDYLAGAGPKVVDVVIANPPFSLAVPFAVESIQRVKTSRGTVAFMLPLSFAGTHGRVAFHREHPCDIHPVVGPRGQRRPSFRADGQTDANEYGWFVWGAGRGGRWGVLAVKEEGTP